MKNITTRQFRILADHMAVYDFMVEIYEKDWRNGVAAPFLEYALSSDWMDKSFTHRNRIWEENGRIVAFCFTEAPVTDIYFSLRPGYEALAPEMIEYAVRYMPNMDGKQQLILFRGQDALMEAAARAGFLQVGGFEDRLYEYDKPLCFPLPEGFHFVEPGKDDPARVAECCWKGFDHEAEEGPWDGNEEGAYHLLHAPHATPEYPVVIESDAGEYACYAGMWWVPQNRLAYMEPLCTVPKYRHLGLASAALSELYRRMKPLGATHMTGGGNPFYEAIGYGAGIGWTFWKRA